MTIHEDETIIGALRTLADPDTAGAAPVDSLLRRGHQARTHKSRARGAAAGLGLAGLATALTAVAVTGSAGPPAGQPVSFALAAKATAETSFHFKITAVPIVWPKGEKGPRLIFTFTGAHDPVRGDGYFNEVKGVPIRLPFPAVIEVGGTCYVQKPVTKGDDIVGWRWGKQDSSCFGEQLGGVSRIGDPVELLKKLVADGSAKLVSRTGHGRSEVDVWTYSFSDTGAVEPTVITGTITVEAASQHVTKLTSVTHIKGTTSTPTATYEFSDFGAPVHVTAPDTNPSATPSPAN